MKKIAVTGGLACGKSTVCHLLHKLGAHVASADEIVHRLLTPHTNTGRQVIDLLGCEIVHQGTFDRQKIAQKVFQNKVLLKSLETILHPVVFEEIKRLYEFEVTKGTATLFVVEVPLLFEVGAASRFDATIAVVADPKICKKRFKETSGQDDAEYQRRMSQQMPISEKAAKADYIIENNGDLADLEKQVSVLYQKLLSLT